MNEYYHNKILQEMAFLAKHKPLSMDDKQVFQEVQEIMIKNLQDALVVVVNMEFDYFKPFIKKY